MAASSEGEVTAEVQAYLDKHKISSLMKDLMSKVVKDLPADPVEFLISKLQILHRQRKKATSPRPPSTSAASSRRKIQVTGTSVTPAAGKPAHTEQLPRSSGNTRQSAAKPRSTLTSASSPSLSKTTPSPTKVQPSRPHRPTTVTTPTKLSKTTGSAKHKTTTQETKRPTTAPTAGKAPTRVATTVSKSSKSTSHTKAAVHGRTANKEAAGNLKVKESVAAVKPSREKEEGPEKRAPSAEEIDEFFGEAKKSSNQRFQSVLDAEEEDIPVSSREAEGGVSGEWSDDEREEGRGKEKAPPTERLTLDMFMKKRLSSKQAKKAHREKLQSLLASSTDTRSTTSSGYTSDTESGDEGDIVMVEDYAALEEEGVTGLQKGKYVLREAVPLGEGATVDLQVLICARCAKVLSEGDRGTEISGSELSQSGEGAVESASQVGSHVSFPQWDSGSAIGSEVSAVHKWMGSHGTRSVSGDSASDVTVQSHDTWGGLAPQPHPQVSPSDDESEVQLPPPPPLEGRPWVQDPPPQHDPHGWGQEDSQ